MLRPLAVTLALLGVFPASAGAVSMSLGSHFGIAAVNSDVDGAGSSTVVSLPSNALTYQPALRLGLSDSRRAHEALLDWGLFLVDEAGEIFSLFAGSANYQHTFQASQRTSPFANIGIGLYRENAAARVSTSTSYGAGIGVRRLVGDRNGILRAEVRVDRLRGDDRSGRPKLTFIGLRLGFDLWL